MYHYVRDLTLSRYPRIKGLDTAEFKQQLDFFQQTGGHFVRLEQVQEAIQGGGSLPENSLLLTFDDGYADDAVALFEGHSVSGPLRGYKGGSWEGGTRVPAFVSCPGMIAGGQVSDTRLCHIDLLASFASYLGIDLPDGSAPDSMPMMDQWLGKSNVSRPYLVEHNHRGVLSYVEGDWKYIEKAVNKKNQKYNEYYGSMPEDMLFNLKEDLGETVDLAAEYPEKVKEMSSKLQAVKNMKTE